MKGKWVGIGLIVFGALLLFKNFFSFDFDVTLFVLGGIFLAAYFSVQKNGNRNIGLLIPGAILVFLGFNELVESLGLLPRALRSMAPLVFISMAFLAIYLISSAAGPKTAHWSLVVSGILLAVAGVTFLAEQRLVSYELLTRYGMPGALILIGLVILLRALGHGRKKSE